MPTIKKQTKSAKPKATKQPKPSRTDKRTKHARPPTTTDTPKPVAPRTSLSPMKATDKITAVAPCPYKQGTKSAANYARYKVELTVEEALKAGCPRDYIAWDRRFKYVTVEPAE